MLRATATAGGDCPHAGVGRRGGPRFAIVGDLDELEATLELAVLVADLLEDPQGIDVLPLRELEVPPELGLSAHSLPQDLRLELEGLLVLLGQLLAQLKGLPGELFVLLLEGAGKALPKLPVGSLVLQLEDSLFQLDILPVQLALGEESALEALL